jgi:Tfp pilus assembly protein PilV
MTLLEALVALVILGLSAIGVLDALHSSSRSSYDAVVWTQAVGYAEAAMEESKLHGQIRPQPETLANGFARRVEVQPFSAPGLERVSVTVTMPNGRSFVLHRLVRVP